LKPSGKEKWRKLVATRSVDYKCAGETLQDFHDSSAFVRGIMGPIGSGKSTACIIELLRRAREQTLSPDGKRKSRIAIIRNSYPELKSTTIKSWFQWVPREWGKFNQSSPIVHHIRTEDLDIEVLFMALDREDDASKLLSLELSFAWINEAREVPKGIVDALTGRVGRYPAKVEGGCTWSGILLDTNPPDDQSWWYKYAEEETPEGWEFFKQPSGLSPEVENLPNLPKDYYKRIMAGKDEDWVKVYCHGQYGYVVEGKPVYPMFRDSTHTNSEIEPVSRLPLFIGLDFGLTPAAVLGQKLVDGRWLILDELVTENCGIVRFAETLNSYLSENYPDHEVDMAWGDPAGNQRAHSDERTALEIMEEYCDFPVRPAPSNEISLRREVVVNALNRMIDGKAGFQLHPRAKMLRSGFAGKYHYKFVKSSNNAMTFETPAKNEYSHVHDSLQYLLLGGGERDVVLRKVKRSKRPKGPRIVSGVDYDLFNT
jgi:hypothetical protein